MSTLSAVVNSWNEWDPLEEVVVGSADGSCFEPSEPANRPQIRNARPGTPFPTGPKSHGAVERANEELAGLGRIAGVARSEGPQAEAIRLQRVRDDAGLLNRKSVLRGLPSRRDDHGRNGNH